VTTTRLRELSSHGASLGAAVPVRLGERTEKTSYLGRPAAEMKADHREWLDEQPTSTRCLFCDWTFDGTAAECRDAARVHREQKHPEATVVRGHRGRMRLAPKGQRTAAENAQAAADAAEARRVRAEREDAERLAKIERGRQRDALEAMDAGAPQRQASEGEDAGAGPEGTSSPPLSEPELEEEHVDHGNRHASPVAARWPKKAILEAIVAHAERTGFVPRSTEWDGPSTEEHPNAAHVTATFGNWGNAVEAAGYPRPLRGGRPIPASGRTGSGREPSGGEPQRPTPDGNGAALAQAEEPASRLEHEPAEPTAQLVVAAALRDPIRTAEIPYDAEILEDEAAFLRERADALDLLASGVRRLAEVSRRDRRDEEHELAA
jgi:hypothetical protein